MAHWILTPTTGGGCWPSPQVRTQRGVGQLLGAPFHRRRLTRVWGRGRGPHEGRQPREGLYDPRADRVGGAVTGLELERGPQAGAVDSVEE